MSKEQANTQGNTPLDNFGDALQPSWKPGVSGNPNGRPKGAKTGMRAHLDRILNTEAPENVLKALKDMNHDLEGGTMGEVISLRLVLQSLGGDLDATKEINRVTVRPLAREPDPDNALNEQTMLAQYSILFREYIIPWAHASDVKPKQIEQLRASFFLFLTDIFGPRVQERLAQLFNSGDNLAAPIETVAEVLPAPQQPGTNGTGKKLESGDG